jgi:uncharacterized membrane protein YeiH
MTDWWLLQHVGVAVAAVTGVLAARGKQVDLFGVIVLALVTALGGGTIRDCTLGDFPVFWVKAPNYVLTAVFAALVTFYIARSHRVPLDVLQVADAFALAFFTLVGLLKALSLGASPAIAVLMGVTTGVAGGILRDLLLNEIPLVFRPGIYLYATAAFVGSAGYFGLRRLGVDSGTNTLASVAAILALRLAGIRWRLSLPVFTAREPVPTGANARSTQPPTRSATPPTP